jgi:hypothetical protein
MFEANAIRICKKTVGGILDQMYPIGYSYTQYSDATGAFIASEEPGQMWPGTIWMEMFSGDGAFFKTTGYDGSMARSNGLQGDAIRNITGSFTGGMEFYGAFYQFRSSLSSYQTVSGFGEPTTGFSASRVVPTDEYNHPRNRLVKIWKRTN